MKDESKKTKTKVKLKVKIRSIKKNTQVKNRNWRDLTPSHECPYFLLIQALCKNQHIRKVIKYWRSIKGKEINQTFIPAKKPELFAHASLILKLFRLTRIVLPPSFIWVSHVIETIIIFFFKVENIGNYDDKSLHNEEFLLGRFKHTPKCWNDGTTNSQAH